MSGGHAAARRQRFAPRGHELREREAGDVRRITFKVAASERDDAVEIAKRQARDEGWRIRTLQARLEMLGDRENDVAVIRSLRNSLARDLTILAGER